MKKFLRASLPALYLCALFAVAGAQSRSLDGAWQFAVDREGKLTINTTFRLADAYGKDEYARRLLDEMIRLVSAEGFEPKLTIDRS